MSDIAVRVENLSKKYHIGQSQQRRALRDRLATGVGGLFRRPHGSQEAHPFIWALKDVSFEVPRGQVLGIIGRNGAGKSTLLKILSRITRPTAGYAEIRGSLASLLEVGTGFHSELTGRENIYLNGAILGMSRREIDHKFDEIVAFAGSQVEKYIDTPVKRYSSGMYVRLAFAVASFIDPDVLVIDEVLSVGDQEFQKRSLGKMQDVVQQGRTVLFVSHNLAAVGRLCSTCIYLDEGRVVAAGPTDDVVALYTSQNMPAYPYYEQPHDPTKMMNLRAATIETHNGSQGADIGYDDPFTITLTYEVNHPVSGCYVGVTLLTQLGEKVFFTADYDEHPELIGGRQPGLYRARVHIPAQWLNVGRYFVRVFVTDLRTKINFDRVDALGFTITDKGIPGAPYGDTTRGGILLPILDWETAPIPQELRIAE